MRFLFVELVQCKKDLKTQKYPRLQVLYFNIIHSNLLTDKSQKKRTLMFFDLLN